MQQSQGFSSSLSGLSTVPKSIRALAMMLAISAGGTLGVAPALADDDKKEAPKVDRIEGDFDQRIDEVQPRAGQGGSSFTISNSWTQNGKSYTVTNKNGDINVKVDGEKLAADRWREKNGKLEILDSDGNVEATTDMPSMDNNGGIRLQWGQRGGARNQGNNNELRRRLNEMMGAPQAPAAPAIQRPPVMLGINMSVVDEGVLVDRVIDDLPADKAGVREGDIITKVSGEQIADTMDIVQTLCDRKPGDKIDIVVLRDGKERTLTADLVAYDPETIELRDFAAVPAVPGVPEVPGLIEVPMLDDLPILGQHNAQLNNLRAQLEKLSEDLRAQAEALAKQQGDAKDSLSVACKALEDAADQLAQAREQMNERRARGNVWVAPGGQGNGQMFVFPENGNRVRIERDASRERRTNEARESSDDLKDLRHELQQLREEMKELREKNEQQSKDKP